MADLVALGRASAAMVLKRPSLSPQSHHFPDGLLLGFVRDEFAGVAAPEPKGNLPAKVSPTGLLIGFHLANALANAIALGLGEGGGDRQEQLRQAVA